MKGILAGLLIALVSAAAPSLAAVRDVAHPFMLWTRDEAAAIRKQIDTDPDAQKQYERVKVLEALPKGQMSTQPTIVFHLFNYLVMGDKKVAETEKRYLLDFIGKTPEDALKMGASRHYDCTWDALRYDVLYDQLTPEERKGLEDTFRVHIQHQLKDDKVYTRTSWLPNMQWPRVIAAHLMALVMKDEQSARALFASNGGWKWYFDSYIADGMFYMEEFGKFQSMPGEMLMWCEMADRLGLGELGYDYKGKGGATMQRYMEQLIWLGYPRTDVPGGMPNYQRITMGDARFGVEGFPPLAFQHPIVDGSPPGKVHYQRLWNATNMNGRDHKNTMIPKMLAPLWLEMAHRRWPDAGFDYFLAQMRALGDDRYYSTLYFGLPPIDPKKVKAPSAPSYVAPERGFVFLRADESEKYWESPKPAVALQLGMYYVHYTHDCFSLLGYHAFNRPIYVNRGISAGYAGDDAWTDTMRGHCGVMVDNKQVQPVDNGDSGMQKVKVRSSFEKLVKFASARASGLYEGVDQERSLFLTDQYLFDVIRVVSDRPRLYDWQVHTLGTHQRGADPWQATAELDNGKLYEGLDAGPGQKAREWGSAYDLRDVARLDAADKPWAFTAIQTCQLLDEGASRLGDGWYDRKIGVRVSMLEAATTTVYAGKTPIPIGTFKQKGFVESEVGGITLLVRRKAPSTTFVALHEPFEKGKPRPYQMARLQETDQGIVVAITGGDINDRILLRTGDGWDQPLTLASDTESFTFHDRAFVRIAKDKVEISGGLTAMKLAVAGKPKLIVNGQECPCAIDGGTMTFGGK